MTMSELGRTPVEARDELLDAAAVDGLDLDAARGRVDTLARGRRRIRRSALGAMGAIVVVLVATMLVLGDEDPDEFVADRAERTTTTSSTSTSTTAAPTVSTTAPPLAPTSVAPVTTVAPTTASTTTTSTVVANQVLAAELRVVTPQVQAGDVATVEVAWVDPDHAGEAPDLSADWGDPSVGVLNLPTPAARCDTAGASSGGVLRRDFRYATPGTHRVEMTLTTCGGEGAFAERVTVSTTIVVSDAVVDGAPATAVVAVAPRTANGLPVLPSMDAAVARFDPSDPALPDLELDPRAPVLVQFGAAGPATVLRLPRGAEGTLRLTWPDSPCSSTAEVALGGPTQDGQVLELTSTC
jgi:hypothetical protein